MSAASLVVDDVALPGTMLCLMPRRHMSLLRLPTPAQIRVAQWIVTVETTEHCVGWL